MARAIEADARELSVAIVGGHPPYPHLDASMRDAPLCGRFSASQLYTRPPASRSVMYIHACNAGKYTNLADSYLSVIESLRYSAIALGVRLDIVWVEASDLEDEVRVRDYFSQ